MNVALWLLAALGVIGAFDTFYYHEWRARLPAQRRQAAPELLLAGRVQAAGIDALEHQAVLGDLEHLRDPQRARGPQPAEPRRLDPQVLVRALFDEAHASSSSRPRHAASTWSSTVSKPSAPP